MRRLGLAVLVTLALPTSAGAASFAVTTTDDLGGAGCAAAEGPCSLRQALAVARSGDVIDLPAGTYAVATPLVAGAAGVTIDGAGARTTTIDGGGGTRLLDVQAPGALTVEGVALRRGRATPRGGAALVARGASLVLVDAAVLDSAAGGTGLEGSGGGVHNAGTLVLLRSLVAGNRAASTAIALGTGGGIQNEGTLAATASTISGNVAGGTTVAGRGGGVMTGSAGSTSLRHVTLADNAAGTIGAGGSLGTAEGGRTLVGASVITGGSARTAAEDCDVPVASLGENVGTGRGCGLTGERDRAGGDALLEALGDDGGPTDTHALRPGSPALDVVRGAAGCPEADQRGFVRAAGTACDAGAFEAGAEPAVPATDVPPPVLGATFNLDRVEGTVLVRRPGAVGFSVVTAREQVPIGTVVIAGGGVAGLTGETTKGRFSSGELFLGSFELAQDRPDTADASVFPVELRLRGAGPDGCSPARRTFKGRKAKRGLWGRTKGGRFRTRGAYSAATVRGTLWFTEDRCDGTLTRVKEGLVSVEDLTLGRTVDVPAGRSYLARAPRCQSRRTVVVTVPGGRRGRRPSVLVDGRAVRVRRGRARVDLRGQRAREVVVRLRAHVPGRGVVRAERRFLTCVRPDGVVTP